MWSLVLGMVVYVDPELVRDVILPGSYLPFLMLLFLALWYTSAVVVARMWLSFVTAFLLTLGVALSIAQMLYWFVGLGIVTVLFVVYYLYFSLLKRI